jgi:hypothetical protein
LRKNVVVVVAGFFIVVVVVAGFFIVVVVVAGFFIVVVVVAVVVEKFINFKTTSDDDSGCCFFVNIYTILKDNTMSNTVKVVVMITAILIRYGWLLVNLGISSKGSCGRPHSSIFIQ